MTTPPPFSLLVVDDEPDLRTLYELTLLREGYDIDTAGSVEEALARLDARRYSLMITDMRLPDGSGLDLLRRLEETGRSEKTIVITAYGSAENAVEALKAGAYDYLTKPVDLDEVTARVRAITRRAQQAQSGGAGVLRHGALSLQPARLTATWKGRLVPLTNREFWLLETLVRKKGQVLSRERLEEALYGWGDEVDSNAVEVYIHHLRRKFDPALIKTVRGLGYHLGAETDHEVEG